MLSRGLRDVLSNLQAECPVKALGQLEGLREVLKRAALSRPHQALATRSCSATRPCVSSKTCGALQEAQAEAPDYFRDLCPTWILAPSKAQAPRVALERFSHSALPPFKAPNLTLTTMLQCKPHHTEPLRPELHDGLVSKNAIREPSGEARMASELRDVQKQVGLISPSSTVRMFASSYRATIDLAAASASAVQSCPL